MLGCRERTLLQEISVGFLIANIRLKSAGEITTYGFPEK